MKSFSFSALAAACAFVCGTAQAAPVYHVAQDLGVFTVAAHVSPRGTIEGTTYNLLGTWIAGTWRKLPHGDGSLQIKGVDDNGQMSGYWSVPVDGNWLPEVVYVVPHGSVTAQSEPQTNGFLEVGGIAHDGTLVGALVDSSTGLATCESWHDGVQTTIGVPPGGWECLADAINTSGQIAGEAGFAGGPSIRLYLYDHGTWTPVPGLSGGLGGQVAALSDNGHIVGQGYGDANGNMHGLFWNGHRSVDIGTLGGLESGANGVDAKDTVVGWAQDSMNAFHAVVWQHGQLTDLAHVVDNLDASWRLISAIGITTGGTIVVNALTSDYTPHILLLTPVTE